LPWLEAAASTKIALAALVVLPSTVWLYVIQGLVSQMDLRRTETDHTSEPAAWSLARCFTETDIKGLPVVGVLTKGASVLSAHFRARKRLFREAKQASHGDGDESMKEESMGECMQE
jgi:hypothetical protein